MRISLFKKGFVDEDSTFYGVLGIISVVGVVVCPHLDVDVFVTLGKTLLLNNWFSFLTKFFFSVHDCFILTWNGAYSVAYNVWGTNIFIYHITYYYIFLLVFYSGNVKFSTFLPFWILEPSTSFSEFISENTILDVDDVKKTSRIWSSMFWTTSHINLFCYFGT